MEESYAERYWRGEEDIYGEIILKHYLGQPGITALFIFCCGYPLQATPAAWAFHCYPPARHLIIFIRQTLNLKYMMNDNLSFNFWFSSKKFDFWPIYEAIKKVYPLGIQKSQGSLFDKYPGRDILSSLLTENIHNNKNYKAVWKKFEDGLKKKIGHPIVSTTYGQAPSFSSYVELLTDSFDNVKRTKEIHYAVSLLGPFYTVIGQENFQVKIDQSNFYSTAYLVVSPLNEYADTFNLLCKKIEDRFKGYRFVPFHISNSCIDGLSVYYGDHPNRIFYALFNGFLDTSVRIIGDEFYKASDWIRDGYVDDGHQWVIYPPVHQGE
ncbi:MAG: hypothetical protein QM791_16655 [Ferruginibacter sp.]